VSVDKEKVKELLSAKPPIENEEALKLNNPNVDKAIVASLVGASCELHQDKSERNACWELLRPLDKDSGPPPEDVLAEFYIKEFDKGGLERMHLVADRTNYIQWKALQKAKQKLIEMGKLNPDGTPKT